VPAQVAAIVGDEGKQLALGFVHSVTQIGACWGPVLAMGGAVTLRCH
jgi:hypothetical protein